MRKLFISALAFLALPLFAQKEASIPSKEHNKSANTSTDSLPSISELVFMAAFGWVPTLTYLIHKGIVMMCSTP